MLVLREPAPLDFLARRLTAIDWHEGPPAEGSRIWLVETCRAELEWACADWRRLGGDLGETGPAAHPSDAWRLPHERAAARLVNCHLHVDVEGWRIGELLRRLPGQRRATLDITQSAAYGLAWANRAAGTLDDLRLHRLQRRLAWRGFLAAADEYRGLRAALKPRQPLDSEALDSGALNSGAEIGQIALREVA